MALLISEIPLLRAIRRLPRTRRINYQRINYIESHYHALMQERKITKKRAQQILVYFGDLNPTKTFED